MATFTALQRWQGLARGLGSAVAAKGALAGRPAPNAQPEAIATWLNKQAPGGGTFFINNGVGAMKFATSPVFLYPEWPWTVSGDTATAGYDLAAGDHVVWTAQSDGAFHYEHTWGGFDLGRTLDDAINGIAIAADLSGYFLFVGMFLHAAQAIVHHESLAQVGQGLKADYDAFQNMWSLSTSVLGYVEDPPSLLYAVQNGDWAKTWNEATNYGHDLSGITAAWGSEPAPDVTGQPSATVSAVLKDVASPPKKLTLKMIAPQAAPAKGPAMAAKIVLQMPSNASWATPAAKQAYANASTAIAVKSPAPTPANPQGGRTLFGVPVLDVGVGAVAVVGLAWLAKAKHWL